VTDLQARAVAAVERAAALSPGAQIEAEARQHHVALTRFANSAIHQNIAEVIATVRIRMHRDGRTAAGSATVTDDAGLQALAERVAASVDAAPLDPRWPGLAPPAPLAGGPPLDESTISATPTDRAQIVRGFVDGAAGLETAGYCRTGHGYGAFANSAGHVAVGESAECSVSGIARCDGADGVARLAPSALADLDGHALGARAGAKARAGVDPIELPPGRYDVVLEPTAVADILETLATAGFNGKAVNERRSFVRVGDRQLADSITLVDEPDGLVFAYDDEGTPRQRLVLVDRGTCVAVTHDRRSAGEAGHGATSTGHALSDATFAYGPIARHLTLQPAADAQGLDADTPAAGFGPAADPSVAELVGAVDRGILVTDLWYTRMLDPRSLAITGLTRNGVWLIEHGEITAPLRNLRFTQSYAQALMPDNVKAVGRIAIPVPGDSYVATSPRWTGPALHLVSWNFTGGASG
jgi:predicted Zn-dependent protease